MKCDFCEDNEAKYRAKDGEEILKLQDRYGELYAVIVICEECYNNKFKEKISVAEGNKWIVKWIII